ncbi:MAG: GPI anchored serine-threonine rich family protein [Patescibacteria group bacterium]|nr:GPI anchored serine-threonine rich family protein [Patescibacteria group bacterium]
MFNFNTIKGITPILIPVFAGIVILLILGGILFYYQWWPELRPECTKNEDCGIDTCQQRGDKCIEIKSICEKGKCVYPSRTEFPYPYICWEGKCIKEGVEEEREQEIPKKEAETQIRIEIPEEGNLIGMVYRDEEFRDKFEFKYPKNFKIEQIDKGIKIIFPESYIHSSYIFKNDVTDAWIGVGIGIMEKEGMKGDLCQKLEKLDDKEVRINNINFIKGNITTHAMGGWYTDYNIYRTLHNGVCYEILLAVTGRGPGAGAHGGKGPLPEDYAEPQSKEKFFSIFDQMLSTFRFIEEGKKITVTSPAEGEVWEVGRTYQIRWTPSNPEEHIVMRLYKTPYLSLDLVWEPSYSFQNTGTYSFTVFDWLEPGKYQFQISAYGGSGESSYMYSGRSGEFSIVSK